MGFEWDDRKAEENFRKHGVSFEEAAFGLGDPNMVDEPDDRFEYGEPRYKALCMGKEFLLAVVYTERGDNLRIISAREATRHEQDDYYRQNSSGPHA